MLDCVVLDMVILCCKFVVVEMQSSGWIMWLLEEGGICLRILMRCSVNGMIQLFYSVVLLGGGDFMLIVVVGSCWKVSLGNVWYRCNRVDR